MIGGLGSVFDLAQPFVDIGSCFTDGFVKSSGSIKWEQEQVARYPPSFTSFMPRILISR